ncbi:MAG TPA: hypothetical protein PLB63_05620 [Planctomycetota bacterium]|nr:hypothetical protein [Planctomycetota bacterium]HQB00509.1 hypothetical protein [Planctomycetota bacterium]
MLWGSNFALGKQFCSGEAILLWGGIALRRQFCSEEAILLWGDNVAWGGSLL